jgi:hypothetical protein
MAFRGIPNARPATLGDVLSNGKRYVVPSFQRDYAWEETEWAELWSDLVATEKDGPATSHFLGALVLQPIELRTFNIIDGQQRLVTLSVLTLAVIAHLERLAREGNAPDDNRERARLLRERFISTTDSASLRHHSRLRLNDADDGFYQTRLVQGERPLKPAALRGSERRLWDCFEYYAKRLAERPDLASDGAALARFLGDVAADQLSFIEVRVESDETAFTVFETLNARGVALGTSDLIKNYLFSLASKGGQQDFEIARKQWMSTVGHVGQENVASLLFHWMSATVSGMRERRVFVEVKRHVTVDAKNVFTFLTALESAAQLYAALDDPADDFWQQDPPEVRRWLRVLAILRTEQYKPVALAAFDKLRDRPERFAKLLESLAMISLRAIIAKVNTGNLQGAYQDAAFKIGKGELRSPASIARALASITPTDDEFFKAFETLEIDPRGQRKRLLRYILSELEQAASGHAINFEEEGATVEHILPENPGEGWDAFTPERHARDHIRLGNLTPLEGKLNRDLGAAAFERKREVYTRSKYALTRGVVAAEWTPDTLRARQSELAKLAVEVWRVAVLDGA